MTADLPKPAASLTADRIKRGAACIVDVAAQTIDIQPQPGVIAPQTVDAAPQPEAEETLRRQVRETVAANASGSGLGDAIGGVFNWRRAGVFGLVYLGALAIFWSVLVR